MAASPPSEERHKLCTLCRTRRACADSHILPQALHKDLMGDDKDVMRTFGSDPLERVKRSRTGPSDDGILCFECEAGYAKYDQAVVEAFRTAPVAPSRWFDAHTVELPGVRADRLKLGLMHIVWRVHATSKLAFALNPPDAERLRQLLTSDDPGRPEDFATLLAMHDPDPFFGHGIWASPMRGDWAADWYGVHLYYSTWEIMMTCSASGIPGELIPALLEPGKPVLVSATRMPLRDTPMFRAALESARRHVDAGTWRGGNT